MVAMVIDRARAVAIVTSITKRAPARDEARAMAMVVARHHHHHHQRAPARAETRAIITTITIGRWLGLRTSPPSPWRYGDG
jgi:hypothetical protein